MRWQHVLLALLLLTLAAGTTSAAELGVMVGTEPSLTLVTEYSITPRWAATASIGLSLGAGSVQTGSSTVQTASLVLTATAKYLFASPRAAFVPYAGIGARVRITPASVSFELQPSVGFTFQWTSRLRVAAEIAIIIPVSELDAWHWEPRVGFTFRIGG